MSNTNRNTISTALNTGWSFKVTRCFTELPKVYERLLVFLVQTNIQP